jgi:hypothetical protein
MRPFAQDLTFELGEHGDEFGLPSPAGVLLDGENQR